MVSNRGLKPIEFNSGLARVSSGTSRSRSATAGSTNRRGSQAWLGRASAPVVSRNRYRLPSAPQGIRIGRACKSPRAGIRAVRVSG